mmetsp:Transcript_12290/g.29808  ORF Transcript_12290/g.29808 Transcript_12290/m.29808 type:complete len:290 (+) Transcript_12290:146-1015(+)|eukprot:CAMPEP_0178992438 /NCGR_PEP_ID=MMETSP0795-20121207/6114_1 /TAXON_ID=88552 /ORGANISM="Amoebophrya sp., Strain Ameob2" /LENGTH=289 /DNA_ID=CAMNT_0020684319 /DNA_START=112 /DNA_END=981 /DNA_ORIENTATION=+
MSESSHAALWSSIRGLKPTRRPGTFVFAKLSLEQLSQIDRADTLCEFKESPDSVTVVMEKAVADDAAKKYKEVLAKTRSPFEAAWIRLDSYSAAEACGMTAVFSRALAQAGVFCNVLAGYDHDHLFVAKKDEDRAVLVLQEMATYAERMLRGPPGRTAAGEEEEGNAQEPGGVLRSGARAQEHRASRTQPGAAQLGTKVSYAPPAAGGAGAFARTRDRSGSCGTTVAGGSRQGGLVTSGKDALDAIVEEDDMLQRRHQSGSSLSATTRSDTGPQPHQTRRKSNGGPVWR